jgi:dTDP-4-dehydrorhamnose reductase
MSDPKKIWVTGASGQLGRELQQAATLFPGFDFLFTTREECPIEEKKKVRDFFVSNEPGYCINAAAYTAVDKAESDKDNAYKINTEAVANLALLAKEYNCRFIHISTDYVFDGKGSRPYREDDPVEPQGVYGMTKREGEEKALQANPDTIIIRTSWVYSEFGKNFVKTMLKLMSEKDVINVVNDQFGSPTYAADLANTILSVINSGKWVPGIFHYCNQGTITWHEFAVAIRDLAGLNCEVMPITTSEYPTPARRPAYSVLDTSLIQKTYHINPPHWRESLESCLQKLISVGN